jgi:hypothetical protein
MVLEEVSDWIQAKGSSSLAWVFTKER